MCVVVCGLIRQVNIELQANLSWSHVWTNLYQSIWYGVRPKKPNIILFSSKYAAWKQILLHVGEASSEGNAKFLNDLDFTENKEKISTDPETIGEG